MDYIEQIICLRWRLKFHRKRRCKIWFIDYSQLTDMEEKNFFLRFKLRRPSFIKGGGGFNATTSSVFSRSKPKNGIPGYHGQAEIRKIGKLTHLNSQQQKNNPWIHGCGESIILQRDGKWCSSHATFS